ncbi:MAG: OmpA family protein [Fulvivirga sp.]
MNFDTGSDNISNSSEPTLETIYNLLIQAEDTKLKLEGHTDDTGSSESNYDLSQRRAQAVVNFLRGKGIPQTRFQTVIGKGEDEPVANNSTATGRAKNRRVVITLLK